TYVTEIQITCLDRLGIIVDISKILTDMKLPVKSFNAKSIKNNAIFNVKIEITDVYQLEELTRKIGQLRDVLEIMRVSS
ncbi:MAG: bifunctional (p)ppGpp synthetase/guanosine-3,5-bis(diphosphate) 3-pyrophosphohydrolase, partial [Clostridia bacterium]|nr:bifunctional (p)ppGpp synthetase/guanosine-3,5-bis(diphosphate) 3-pyrophosphohydrolase [Clostridia bacterium]